MSIARKVQRNILKEVAFVCLALLTYYIWAKPLKITDPTDPRFSASDFSFSDYRREQLPSVLDVLVRRGMRDIELENLMMSSGGATASRPVDGIKMYSWRLPLIIAPNGIPLLTTVYSRSTEHVTALFDSNGYLISAASSTGWKGIDSERIYDAFKGLSNK